MVVWVLLLLLACPSDARSRRLSPYSFSNMLAAMSGMNIDVGHLLFGGPGAPSTPSPQRFVKANCDNPKPTIVLVPGERMACTINLNVRDPAHDARASG